MAAVPAEAQEAATAELGPTLAAVARRLGDRETNPPSPTPIS
jgi:hypothetical protein